MMTAEWENMYVKSCNFLHTDRNNRHQNGPFYISMRASRSRSGKVVVVVVFVLGTLCKNVENSQIK